MSVDNEGGRSNSGRGVGTLGVVRGEHLILEPNKKELSGRSFRPSDLSLPNGSDVKAVFSNVPAGTRVNASGDSVL